MISNLTRRRTILLLRCAADRLISHPQDGWPLSYAYDRLQDIGLVQSEAYDLAWNTQVNVPWTSEAGNDVSYHERLLEAAQRLEEGEHIE